MTLRGERSCDPLVGPIREFVFAREAEEFDAAGGDGFDIAVGDKHGQGAVCGTRPEIVGMGVAQQFPSGDEPAVLTREIGEEFVGQAGLEILARVGPEDFAYARLIAEEFEVRIGMFGQQEWLAIEAGADGGATYGDFRDARIEVIFTFPIALEFPDGGVDFDDSEAADFWRAFEGTVFAAEITRAKSEQESVIESADGSSVEQFLEAFIAQPSENAQVAVKFSPFLLSHEHRKIAFVECCVEDEGKAGVFDFHFFERMAELVRREQARIAGSTGGFADERFRTAGGAVHKGRAFESEGLRCVVDGLRFSGMHRADQCDEQIHVHAWFAFRAQCAGDGEHGGPRVSQGKVSEAGLADFAEATV